VITRLSLRQSATGPADPLWTGATVYARSAIGAEPPLARVAHWHAPKLSLRSLAAHLTGGAALRPHRLTRKVVGHMSLTAGCQHDDSRHIPAHHISHPVHIIGYFIPL